jgi:hypothetical protein
MSTKTRKLSKRRDWQAAHRRPFDPADFQIALADLIPKIASCFDAVRTALGTLATAASEALRQQTVYVALHSSPPRTEWTESEVDDGRSYVRTVTFPAMDWSSLPPVTIRCVDDFSYPDDVATDQYEPNYDGLPGLAARCWADVWSEAVEDYHPCNAEPDPDSDVGLCLEHRTTMAEAQP